jgi:hypothetical protein
LVIPLLGVDAKLIVTGPMGVGAIFIATLAVTELPPGDPDADTTQVDKLRDVLVPVVAFLVLSSVVTHGMSIPFFSLGRRVHSITYTWSRNASMDTRRDEEPAWTTHARRIIPGQQIVINRDDDAEEGDLSIRRVDTSDSVNGDKRQTAPEEPEDESGGSSSSRTAGNLNGEEIEMHIRSKDSDLRRGTDDDGDSLGEQGAADEPSDGRGTPPLARFREGNHLVIERRHGDGDEVQFTSFMRTRR